MDQAIPAMQAAMKALGVLKRDHITNMKVRASFGLLRCSSVSVGPEFSLS